MHRLQQHILQRLILNPEQRYADLKPVEVEGNLFMYHLRCLMKDGYVEKRANGRYSLSAAGKLYVDRLSLKSLTPRIQPRIVTLMAVEQGGKWLVYLRKRQPLINLIGFPYGKIHLGESIKAAAERELKEKTGLIADLTHVGDGYATTSEAGEPVSQIMFHMFYGKDPKGEILEHSDIGEPMWVDELAIGGQGFMPNVADLLALVKNRSAERFFAQLEHRI
ncbi:MAG TPA: NUDIX domain-containing protein [Candidatus Saccharimonadales bacterium]|nr:NUDIX domain-containing protein [Candidatus Saccharimonadales bacterium]